jgi:repressor LexA
MADRSSKKQRELLLFIDGFIKGNGYGPSYREVMRALGYKSVSTVAVHIDGLIEKGYLRKKDHSARSIEVVTLLDDTPTAKAKKPPLVTQLEEEIQKRLTADNVKADEISVLIDAVAILGSERSDEFRGHDRLMIK